MSVSISLPVDLLLLSLSQIYKAAVEEHNAVQLLVVELYISWFSKKSEPKAPSRVVPLLFYKPRLPRIEIQLVSIDDHFTAICSIM